MAGANIGSAALATIELATGKAVDWHEPGWPRFESDVPHVFATQEIESVPGADELIGRGAQPAWQIMRAAAGQMISAAGFMPGCEALELRYVVTPERGQAHIRMFVSARARTWNIGVAQAAVEAACSALPVGFRRCAPNDSGRFADAGANAGLTVLELRRHEEVTLPQWDYIPADFYYTVNDDPGDGSGWRPFWQVLNRVSSEITVSLLFKATDLHFDERNVLAAVTTDLDLLGEQRLDYDVFGNQIMYPACLNARAARDSWLRRIDMLQRPLLARIAVRGEVQEVVPVASALATAISASTQPTGSHPMYIEAARLDSDRRQAHFSFDWLEILPWGGHGIWEQDSAPVSLRRLPYLFGLNEAASLAVLPVPDEQGVPGFVRSRRVEARRAAVSTAEGSEDSIALGRTIHLGQPTGDANLPLAAVVRHTLIVGSPGSGKTTTVLNLLAQLWTRHKVPFLAIEPIKREYRSLLETPGLEDVRVICLGRDDLSPLRLNPLAPPPGVRREVHASSVMASLKMAMPMFEPLPQLLGQALDLVYERAGWEEDTTTEDGLMPPTLRDLLTSFHATFDQKGYVGESRNVRSAGTVRLESLLRGSQGRLLDTVESSDFAELLRGPVVIELDEIADPDDKAIIAAFILDRIRSAARARGSTGGKLRHVTVVEEAHRLLSKSDAARQRTDGEDARAQSVRAFCEAIAELRAQGEGFILSSQFPAQLADAAVAAAGTRVLHRLETAADRKVVLDDISATEADREASGRLRRGEAITRWPELDEAELIQVVPVEGVDSGRQVDDATVKERMALQRQLTHSLMPYRLCTRNACPAGCTPAVRTAGRLLAREEGVTARRLWEAASPPAIARFKIAPVLLAAAEGDLRTAYCAAVHLAVAGDAFITKKPIDIRPEIIAALREASGKS